MTLMPQIMTNRYRQPAVIWKRSYLGVEYVNDLTDQFQFERLKRLKCFVGPEPFYVWVTRKVGE
jgi:hypothetical protein